MGVRDVVNSGHDDIWWEGDRLGSDLVEKMGDILDMGGERFDKGLEVDIDVR